MRRLTDICVTHLHLLYTQPCLICPAAYTIIRLNNSLIRLVNTTKKVTKEMEGKSFYITSFYINGDLPISFAHGTNKFD